MLIKELRDHLVPINRPAGSKDPMDILCCDTTSFDIKDLDEATHVILGCPQDEGVRRNNGRIGAAEAPKAIRSWLYKLKPPHERNAMVIDLGNLNVTGSLEDIHARQRGVIRTLLEMDKKIIVFGGGNDISYPDAGALLDVQPESAVINVDAHLDMRLSERSHSGTPYRDLIERDGLNPKVLHEVSVQPWANSSRYLEDAKSLGVNLHPLAELEKSGAETYLKSLLGQLKDYPLFVGLDMDSVRITDAPGVSAPATVGLSARTVIALATWCRANRNTHIFEISEVNPTYDVDGRTARLAALAAYTFVYGNEQDL